VISSSAQAVHAVRLLQARGMDESSLHLVYTKQSQYSQAALCRQCLVGFAILLRTAHDCVLRRGKQSGLCSADVLTLAALVDRADDKLSESILHNYPAPCTEQSYAGGNSLFV